METPNIFPPRADLNKEDFDNLVYQKGRNVIHEKSLRCPCKSKSTNQLSSCKNCGGTGWIFINPKETRMVIQGMEISTQYKPFSEEEIGMIRISYNEKEQLSFMDRIVVLDGNSVFNEVLHFKKQDDMLFAYTSYNIKEILYCGLFVNDSTALTKLTEGNGSGQFSYENNIVKLNSSFVQPGEQDISITLRYYHSPTFHVVDVKRETMDSFEYKSGGERLGRLPLSAFAKRAHYMLQANNLAGDRLIDNSYNESICEY